MFSVVRGLLADAWVSAHLTACRITLGRKSRLSGYTAESFVYFSVETLIVTIPAGLRASLPVTRSFVTAIHQCLTIVLYQSISTIWPEGS